MKFISVTHVTGAETQKHPGALSDTCSVMVFCVYNKYKRFG